MSIRAKRSKGVGGFFDSLTQYKKPYDVKLLKTTSAKVGKQLEKMITDETEDALKNLNNEVLSGNQLQQAVATETLKVEAIVAKKRKANPDTPKKGKVKISTMNKFKSNYFD